MTKSLFKKKLCVDCGNAITTNSHGMCDDCMYELLTAGESENANEKDSIEGCCLHSF